MTDTLRVSTASEGRPRKMAEEQNLSKGASYGLSAAAMERLGIHFSRYGLVLTLLLIGALKFTAGEAQGIQPLVANSPLMFWMYRIFSLQGVSDLIGVTEIVVALRGEDLDWARGLIQQQHLPKPVRFVEGGDSRQ